MAHAGGRPTIWNTPEELEAKVVEYFNSTNKVTISGLALYLGVERKTLYNYEERPEFLHIIKKARQTVEAKYEEILVYDKNMAVIFPLKNMGWTDKQEIDQKTEHSGSINHRVDYSKLSDAALREISNLESNPEEGQS